MNHKTNGLADLVRRSRPLGQAISERLGEIVHIRPDDRHPLHEREGYIGPPPPFFLVNKFPKYDRFIICRDGREV
jgi:hypothetical protein